MATRALVLLLCSLFSVTEQVAEDIPGNNAGKLRIAFVLNRHGDRNPADLWVHGLNNASEWPEGLGELTKTGIQQMYRLGQFMRKRYAGFLSPEYKSSEIYVRSTDYNRTIMSALSYLSGLFPPNGSQVWNQHLAWQPVPLHSRPKFEDAMLWMDVPCPRAEYLKQKLQQTPEVKQIMKDNRIFIDLISKRTGITISQLDDIHIVFDALHCVLMHPLEHHLPSWVNNTIIEEITMLYNLSSKYWFSDAVLSKLRGGLLLQDMVKYMRQRLLDSTPYVPNGLKLLTYSAHDETLVAFMQNIDVYDYSLTPLFGAALFVEVYAEDRNLTVRVFYKNGDAADIVPLRIRGCGFHCPLSEFLDRSKAKIPRSFEKECRLEWLIIDWRLFAVVASTLNAILVLVLIAFLLLARKDNFRYQLISNTILVSAYFTTLFNLI